jgi:hypothetical protein
MNAIQYNISRIIVVACLFLSGTALSGQVTTLNPGEISGHATEDKQHFCRNSIYVELLGHGLFYSVNYDYRISDKVSLSAGVSIWTIKSIDILILQVKNIKFRSIPLMVNYLIGKRSSRFELGAGIMPAYISCESGSFFYLLKSDDSNHNTIFPVIANVGYRYQPEDGGFIFRAGITPAFKAGASSVTFGLSIGYGF